MRSFLKNQGFDKVRMQTALYILCPQLNTIFFNFEIKISPFSLFKPPAGPCCLLDFTLAN